MNEKYTYFKASWIERGKLPTAVAMKREVEHPYLYNKGKTIDIMSF